MRFRCCLLLSLLCTVAPSAWAHPVAQGSMEIVVHPQQVEVRIRAANEEAFVVEAFGEAKATGGDLRGVWERHGAYLLRHVLVQAGENPLAGEVVRIVPSEDKTAKGRTEYHLQYTLAAGQPPPSAIKISQDVLREFEFAPGNRWEATYVTRISQEGGTGREGLLLAPEVPLDFPCAWATVPHEAGPAQLDQRALFGAYLHHGIMHILTGYDHMLFMGALVLAAASIWDLVKVVSAFTLAHTLTLILSVLGWVRLPEHIVEPMIAGSIVVVAAQNIFWPRQTRGWSRLLVAFGFGLFHGLGFAGGLLEAMSDLPGVAVVTAIMAFSLGVELGHQAVVLPVYGSIRLAQHWSRRREAVRFFALRYGSVLVCLAGLVYLAAALRA